MIALVSGAAVERLLIRATINSSNYSQVILCAPYIDHSAVARLRALCVAAAQTGCAVTVITTPGGVVLLKEFRQNPRLRMKLVVRARIHTKAYLMLARKFTQISEAVVTSANLTLAGFRSNEELGVHIRCTSVGGRRLLEQVDRSLRRLTIQ
jgi:HKD family nuclease